MYSGMTFAPRMADRPPNERFVERKNHRSREGMNHGRSNQSLLKAENTHLARSLRSNLTKQVNQSSNQSKHLFETAVPVFYH